MILGGQNCTLIYIYIYKGIRNVVKNVGMQDKNNGKHVLSSHLRKVMLVFVKCGCWWACLDQACAWLLIYNIIKVIIQGFNSIFLIWAS